MVKFKIRIGKKGVRRKNLLGLKLFNLIIFLLLGITLSQGFAQATMTTFANDLQLIVDQNPYSQTTAVFILINGGKLADPPGKAGLGYLVTRLCLDPPDSDYLKEFMKSGAEIKMAAKGDFLLISMECLSINFESAIKLIYRSFSRPIFSGIRVSNLKEVLKNNQKKEFDDVDSRADLVLLETFFGSSAYGMSGYGNQLTVETLKTEDANAYYRKYFVGANIIISVVSNLDPKTIVSIIETTFGRLPKGESFQISTPSFQIPQEKEIYLKKESVSALLAVAFPLPPLSPKNYVLAKLLEAIIGRGPGSKIWPLRGEEGLAYEAGSRAILMRGGGLLIIYLKTLAEKFSEAKDKFRKKIVAIGFQGLNEDDLETGRNSFRLWLYQQLESKIKRAEALALHHAFGLEKEIAENYLDKISLDELTDFFKEVFNLDKAVFLNIIPSKIDSEGERSQPELLFWPTLGNRVGCPRIQDR